MSDELDLDVKLPELTETQSFNCCEGCGECEAVEYEWAYSETRDRDTDEVIDRKTHKAFKSSCCGGEVEIWDEATEEAIQF